MASTTRTSTGTAEPTQAADIGTRHARVCIKRNRFMQRFPWVQEMLTMLPTSTTLDSGHQHLARCSWLVLFVVYCSAVQ